MFEKRPALQTAISLRAYVPVPEKPSERVKQALGPNRIQSDRTLVFDTETRISGDQSLRVGCYQFRKGEELEEEGLFYALDLPASEIELPRRYAVEHNLVLRTVAEFIEQVFFNKAHQWRAAIVGFNLPFDLSRLAIKHGSARGKAMRGGFSFELHKAPYFPRVQVRHLSAKAALIQFTKPYKSFENKKERRLKQKRPPKRGPFIDLKTAGGALLSQNFSLDTLSAFLRVQTRKSSVESHGAPLTAEYLDYARTDVQASWECYQALQGKFDEHGLRDSHLSKILSEAGLGKAYLGAMNIGPQTPFPPELMGQVVSTYYGGRSEVRWRRQIRQVQYCDFLSMYPTVCTLQGFWKFIIAQEITSHPSTEEVRRILQLADLRWLQDPANWPKLTAIVRVQPSETLVPVRAKYNGLSNTIGLNRLTVDGPLWFTLADLIASKILSGETPEIIKAITFQPGAPQEDLKPVAIAGIAEYTIDPYTDDFFKRLIDLRSSIKKRMELSKGDEWERLNAQQLALKILANSTGYGIYMQLNVNQLDKKEHLVCYGPSDDPYAVETDKIEEPGQFFNPVLATLITGAARLMLGIAEKLTASEGLDWAFCDTDSMAIVKPDDLPQGMFETAAARVRDWFLPLNPYEGGGQLFKLEDANSTPGRNELEPLYCICISAKRYVLFNLGADGKPVIRKASAHGLGQFVPPYGDDDGAPDVPSPTKKQLRDAGVRRWQYDLWYHIILAYQEGHPDIVPLDYHPALTLPAASRYQASSPTLLRWFKGTNKGKPYADQVKPFNFLLALHAKPADLVERLGPRGRGRPKKQPPLKPIAPFHQDQSKAAQHAFDRETGTPILVDQLKTYKEALSRYHLSPEPKFDNGGAFDSGRTIRRHVVATGVEFIGKESNRWEEALHLDLSAVEVNVEYRIVKDN